MKNSRRYEGQVFYDNNINEEQYNQIESNLKNECYTALVYDGMVGIGDGDLQDCIPDWLGLGRCTLDKPCGELHELDGEIDESNNSITDIFNLVNSITFCCDEDGDVNRVVLEFDRESIIREIKEVLPDFDFNDKFTDLIYTYTKINYITEGHGIPKSNYGFSEY